MTELRPGLIYPIQNSIQTNHDEIRAAIVDLDGTMVDTLGDFEVALNRMLTQLGLASVDRLFIERTVGKGGEHLVRQTLAHVGADIALFEAAWAAYQQHYAEINGQHSQVFESVVGLFEKSTELFRRTARVAVGTWRAQPPI